MLSQALTKIFLGQPIFILKNPWPSCPKILPSSNPTCASLIKIFFTKDSLPYLLKSSQSKKVPSGGLDVYKRQVHYLLSQYFKIHLNIKFWSGAIKLFLTN